MVWLQLFWPLCLARTELSDWYNLLGALKGASFSGCGDQAVMGGTRCASALPMASMDVMALAARTACRIRMKASPIFFASIGFGRPSVQCLTFAPVAARLWRRIWALGRG